MKSVLTVLLALILSAAVVIGVSYVGYEFGWWLQEKAVNRQTSIANDSVGRQQGLLDESSKTLDDIRAIDTQLTYANADQKAALTAQRTALITKFCKAAGGLTGRLQIPDNVQAFNQKECA